MISILAYFLYFLLVQVFSFPAGFLPGDIKLQPKRLSGRTPLEDPSLNFSGL
jgi:hypothetical protein